MSEEEDCLLGEFDCLTLFCMKVQEILVNSITPATCLVYLIEEKRRFGARRKQIVAAIFHFVYHSRLSSFKCEKNGRADSKKQANHIPRRYSRGTVRSRKPILHKRRLTLPLLSTLSIFFFLYNIREQIFVIQSILVLTLGELPFKTKASIWPLTLSLPSSGQELDDTSLLYLELEREKDGFSLPSMRNPFSNSQLLVALIMMMKVAVYSNCSLARSSLQLSRLVSRECH